MKRKFVAGLGLAGLLWLPAINSPPALAYQGCQGVTASISADPTVASPGQPVTVTVTFTSCNGDPLAGVLVTFSQQTGPANCQLTFNPQQAVTNANGQATTVVTLPQGCPCQFVVAATGAGITVTTTIIENGCLPFTSTQRAVRAEPPVSGDPRTAALLIAMLGLLLTSAGTAGLLLRARRTRAQ